MTEQDSKKQALNDLSHLKTAEDVLLALTAVCADISRSKSTVESDQLATRLFQKAIALGVPNFEVVRAAMHGMTKKDQQRYFEIIERENVYGNARRLTMDELMTIKKEFSLQN